MLGRSLFGVAPTILSFPFYLSLDICCLQRKSKLKYLLILTTWAKADPDVKAAVFITTHSLSKDKFSKSILSQSRAATGYKGRSHVIHNSSVIRNDEWSSLASIIHNQFQLSTMRWLTQRTFLCEVMSTAAFTSGSAVAGPKQELGAATLLSAPTCWSMLFFGLDLDVHLASGHKCTTDL